MRDNLTHYALRITLVQTRPTLILLTFSNQQAFYLRNSPTAGEPAPIPMKDEDTD